MLTLITAQHFERLQACLVAELMQPAADPLRSDLVLVPSAALRRTLSLAIADHCGICAQVEFSFLAQWLWARMAMVLPEIPVESPFDPDRLRWRILRQLQGTDLPREHARLARYLAGADAVVTFALAGQLARLFDQYITYRGDWLAAWGAGRLIASRAADRTARADEAWQAALWRALLAEIAAASPPGRRLPATGTSSGHPLERFGQRLTELAATGGDLQALAGVPAVVHVFALPTLAPLYLDALAGLSAHTDVRLYVLDPSRAYWYDLVSMKHLARLEGRGEVGYHEVGHRLLTAWGGQTQALMQLLVEHAAPRHDVALEEDGPDAQAGATTLLQALQAGMVALQDLVPGSLIRRTAEDGRALPPCAPDGSLQVHRCHSLVRQLEVLHDHLLRSFAADASLRPDQILVVLPDLETAAPLIESVFGAGSGGRPERGIPAIPFVITGLAPAASSPLAQALLAILQFARSRLLFSDLCALLQQPLVADGFGLTPAALPLLITQLQAADVHWGLDAAHVEALQLPSDGAHTLEEGLARLMLGFALPDGHAGLWQGRLPAGAGLVEGSSALLLGVLHACVQRLTVLRARLTTPGRPADWIGIFEGVLQQWLPVRREQAAEHLALRAELQALQAEWMAAGQEAALSAEVVLVALQERLQGHASGGVPTGAVTFAALPSLRAVPFRHIGVLGLDDGVFPGVRRPVEFDLMAAAPRLGDRQRSEDQRNLFLDLMLAARDGLYLSYTGCSARDGSERPPSVLLAELLDAVVPALCPPEADAAMLATMRRRLVTAHALQPFDVRYFLSAGQPGALPTSFQAGHARAMRQRVAQRQLTGAPASGVPALPTVDALLPSPISAGSVLPVVAVVLADGLSPAATGDEDSDAGSTEGADTLPEDAADGGALPRFFDQPLPAPDAAWHRVSLDQLIRWLRHPARYLLQQRLGVQLPPRQAAWSDAEDFLPAFDAGDRLARRLLPALLAEVPLADLTAVAAAGQEFPAGPLGDAARTGMLRQLDRFAARIRAEQAVPEQPGRVGSLAFVLADQPWTLHATCTNLRDAQLAWRFHAARAGDELDLWVRHLWLAAWSAEAGQAALPSRLLCRDETLYLPPVDGAWARQQLAFLLAAYRAGLCAPAHFYPRTARVLVDSGKPAKALACWKGVRGDGTGEGHDPWWQLALRGVDEPLDAAFGQLAEAVWRPYLDTVQGLAP